MPLPDKKFHKTRLSAVIERLESLYPDARTALHYENPFQLLIATILSAQATDKQVNRITRTLFASYSSPEDFLTKTPGELAQEIRGCGLYQVKSRYILESSRLLLERYSGQLPETREELMTFPGVGRKTANVILSVAFHKPAIAVDTHVFRLARRLGFSRAKTVEEVEEDLMQWVPKEKWSSFHHWLIYHGRQVCRARKPSCDSCPISHLCPACPVGGDM